MVPARGLEPRTLGLKDRCSTRLSYAGVLTILNCRRFLVHARHALGSSEPAEASGARRGRAVALTALALIATAAAGFVYLRLSPTSHPQFPASTVNPLQVSNLPVDFVFVTPSVGWAALAVPGQGQEAGQFIVFRTTDGAQHWQQQFVLVGQSSPGFGSGSYAPISVQIFGKTRGFMTVGFPVEGLYRTDDGGAHWVSVPLLSLTIDAVKFSDARSGWLSGSFTSTSGQILVLFATHDSGDSWSRLPDPPPGAAGLAYRVPTEAWLGGSGPGLPHVFRSSDAGQSWVRRDLPPPAGRSWTPDPFFSNFPTTIQLLPGRGAIAWVEAITCVLAAPIPGTCLNANAETFLFTSVDGAGNTWRSVPPPPGVVAYQDATHWWATSTNTLFKSANAGQSWKQVATLPADRQFSTPGVLDSAHGWAAVFVMGGYGLALTNDGGLHWTLANVPKPAFSS